MAWEWAAPAATAAAAIASISGTTWIARANIGQQRLHTQDERRLNVYVDLMTAATKVRGGPKDGSGARAEALHEFRAATDRVYLLGSTKTRDLLPEYIQAHVAEFNQQTEPDPTVDVLALHTRTAEAGAKLGEAMRNDLRMDRT